MVGEANLVVRFPSSPTRCQSTNNIARLAVQRFEMAGNGYHVYGNSITMAAAPTGTNFTMSAGIGAFLHLPLTLPTTRRLILDARVESTGPNGGITMAGGNLRLIYSNSFAGPLRIQSGSEVYAHSSHVFGSTNGPTIIEGGQLFLGYGCFVPAELLEVRQGNYLTVAATNAWNGPVYIHTNQTLNVWSSSFGGDDWLTLGGPISGPGKMTYFIDRVEFTGNQPNTLSGGHFFRWKTFVVLDKTTSNALTGPITLD